MTANFGVYGPQIQLLATDGVTVLKTLNMPLPDNSGLSVTWTDIGLTQVLANGTSVKVYKVQSQRYIPSIDIKYKVYDELLSNTIYTVGTGNGDTPDLADLCNLLGQYNGRLAINSGPGTPFFYAYVGKMPKLLFFCMYCSRLIL